MRRGTCDKCGSQTIHAAPNGIVMGSQFTEFRTQLEPGFRGIAPRHRGEAWQFACTTCGYLEWHVLDPGTLDFIRGAWGEVRPQ